MPLPHRIETYRRSQATTTVSVVAAMRRLWATLGDGDWDAQWQKIAPRMLAVMTAGQVAAGTKARDFVAEDVASAGLDSGQVGQVSPRGLAGIASDGLPLAGLLYQPVLSTRMFVDPKSLSVKDALAFGQKVLDRIVTTQMADAKRDAESVQMHTYPRVQYAYRVVYPPCCDRCAVLAGKRLRLASADFLRHPGCDCGYAVAGDDTEPYDNAQSLFDDGKIRGLSKADAQAIADGADPAQVINAHSGMATATDGAGLVKYTTEGTTRRGVAGRLMRERHSAARAYQAEMDDINRQVRNARQREKRGSVVDWSQIPLTPRRSMPVRLRPETIYRITDSREQAVGLLRKYGYIL